MAKMRGRLYGLPLNSTKRPKLQELQCRHNIDVTLRHDFIGAGPMKTVVALGTTIECHSGFFVVPLVKPSWWGCSAELSHAAMIMTQ